MINPSLAWPLLVLIAAFQCKHFICDGPLQTKAMVLSKAIYGQKLGLAHSLIHGLGTALVLAISGAGAVLTLGLACLDFMIHYHVDFFKENIVKRAGWTPKDSPFWWALSADQTLHQLTYLALVAMVIRS